MSDVREALAQIIRAEYDKHPAGRYPTERALADAILAEFDVTPSGERDDSDAHDHKWQRRQNVTSRGYRMTPYEVCVADGCDAARQVDEPAPATEHPCGDYPAPCNCDDPETHDGAVPATERDELRAEVERLRAVSAAQPYETERELAVALDEARQQVADLRAGIEALAAEYEKPNPSTLAYRSEVARAVRALSGSGEQPGEVEGYCTCHDDQKGRTRDCGVKVHREAGRPAPVVPDSTGVRSVVAARVAFEEAGVRLMAVAGADATRYLDALGRVVAAGATVGDIAALASPLAAVGQGVTAEPVAVVEHVHEDRPVITARVYAPESWKHLGLGTHLYAAVRPSGQEGS